MALVAHRYRVDRELGRGGSAVVFAAADTWLDERPIALKILTSRDPLAEERLRRELAILYRLRHPHLCRVFELGRLVGPRDDLPAGALFLAEELCDGRAASTLGRLSPAVVASIGAQLAAALAALHARGFMHGDVTPNNVLVSDDRRVKLIDFGMAQVGVRRGVSGTLRFMAPEAMSGSAGAPSDVYGLAASLAELLEPGAPREPGKSLRGGPLADALGAMSEADPRRRADAAAAFAMLLAHTSGDERQRLMALRDTSAAPATVVGRDDVLAQLDATLGEEGGRRVVRLRGAPGIGKTAVLSEAAARGVLRGFEVPGGVRSAGAGGLGEIERLLREVGVSVPLAAPRRGEDATAARYRRFADITDGLRALPAGRLLVIFDDVPPGSPLDELSRYLERLRDDAPPMVWIQASTSTEAEGALVLGPLDAAGIERFIAAARPLRPHDQKAADAVLRASFGVPGRAAHVLATHPGDQLLRAATSGELRELHEGSPAEGLPDEAIRVSAAVAQFDAPVGRGLLASVPSLAPALAPHVLDTLFDRGVLAAQQVDDELGLLVAGDGMRSAFIDRAGAPLLRELAGALAAHPGRHDATAGRLWLTLGDHARAVPFLERAARRYADDLRYLDAVRLYDLLLTTPDTGQHASLRVAAARALLAAGRAADAEARLRELTTHPQARVARAEALVALGRYVDAAESLEPTDDLAGDDLASAEALAARANMLAGRYDDAVRVLQRARARAADHPRATELDNVDGVTAFYGGELEKARAVLEGALARATRDGDARGAEQSRANLALVLHKSGEHAAAEKAYETCVRELQASRDLPRQLLRLTNLASLRQEQAQFTTALDALADAEGLAHLTDNTRAAVRVRMNQANLLCWLGATAEARAQCDAARADADRLGMGLEQGYLTLVSAEIAVGEGDLGRAAAQIVDARERFERAANRGALAEVDAVAAEVALRKQEHERAADLAGSAAAEARTLGRDRIEVHALLWRGLSSLQAASSFDELPRLLELAQKLPDPDLGWLAHALASRLAARARREAEAKKHETQARRLFATSHARLPSRYDAPYRGAWFRRELLGVAAPSSSHQPREVPMSDVTRDFDRLLAINRELASDHDPERLLERIIDAAIALSGAERGFILLKTEGAEGLEIRTARRTDKQALAAHELDVSTSIAGQVIASGAPVSTVDAQDDERFRAIHSVHSLKLRSVLCLPLSAPQGPLGALYLDHRYRVNAFSDTDVALLAAFGDQAAIALANARLVRELEQRSAELERSRASIEELNQRLEQELAASKAELEIVRSRTPDGPAGEEGRHGMVGRSPAMRAIYKVIDRVADKEVPVTISGESGTGKELVARAVHAASSRKGGPFVPVNCGAIPAQLLESELFGHEKGAFTGAVRGKPGLFEIARGGTIFLDEIGDMPLAMQVKLLRVLQTREFRRVGGTSDLTSDARVVSATNRDLEAMVRDGTFREDLWYRLNVVELRLPPLRERREDLPLLIQHLLAKHGGDGALTLNRAALATLLDYDWPGNIRELENEIQRAIALSDGTIDADAFSSKLKSRVRPAAVLAEAPAVGSLRDIMERCERDTIRAALGAHNGRVAAAAEALGLTRAGLYKKIHKYNLQSDN